MDPDHPAALVPQHRRAIANARRAAGLPVTCGPAVRAWPFLVFGLNTWYTQRELNLVVEAHAGAAPGTRVLLAV
ncbi:hypothetical protein GA0115239_104823 [Streptomyces sp. BpilaLS-43]|nr:hypothetical protein GA0115239_104823 [Streptomyces sp. BpilaLS-43]